MFGSPKAIRLGQERLFARLGIANSDYFPDITVEQASNIKVSYLVNAKSRHNLNLQVKAYLSAQGVSSIFYMGYYAFAYQVQKTLNSVGCGESGVVAVAILLTKWVNRGLSLSVCEGIRTTVFNVGAPASP